MLPNLAAAALSVALLMIARPAHADAVADFKTGTTVVLRAASVDLGKGELSSSGSGPIRKSAGTLDFSVEASDLGVPLPITIRLRGSSLGGGWILYTVDESYSPTLDLGGGHSLSRVTGRVYAIGNPLPGTNREQLGNVKLTLAASSYLDARGDWGTLRIAIKQLELIGGVPQPSLDAFADTGGLICSDDRVATEHAFSVSLSGVAQANGATVQLVSPRADGVRLPSALIVPAGHRSNRIGARIAPGFVGTVRLSAAAGGVTRSLEVSVHPHGDCALRR